MGVYIEGFFLLEETKEYDGELKTSVVVAVGATAYRVYMTNDYDGFYNGCKPGEKVTIRARPYVTKKGALAWTEGEPA